MQTPLHLAAEYGHVDVVEILLRNGANVNAKDVRIHRNEKWWRTERLRGRVNNYENGKFRGRWFVCEERKKREKENYCLIETNEFLEI